jgi:2-haloalkanoic acid dehalogenase type II
LNGTNDGRVAASEVLTLDCYGTLIDWETGIRNSFRQAFSGGRMGDLWEDKLFNLYLREEARIEKTKPFRPYREVLSQTVQAVAEGMGWNLAKEDSSFLADDLPRWTPFPDTNPALTRLASRYRLGILSNVDNDLLESTLKHLAVPFEFLVTAEQVRSYKPAHAHFERAKKLIGHDCLWVHAAASLYHDIEPTLELGIRSVWVDRGNERMGKQLGHGVKVVDNLAELADLLLQE